MSEPAAIAVTLAIALLVGVAAGVPLGRWQLGREGRGGGSLATGVVGGSGAMVSRSHTSSECSRPRSVVSIDGLTVRAVLETDPGTLGQEGARMLRADILRHVCVGRPGVVVSMAPRSWSAVEEIPGRSQISLPSQRFPVYVLATDAASDELLSFIGRSEDFERGYCWIVLAGSVPIDPGEPLVQWLLDGMATPAPYDGLEVLSMDSDGDEISWTAPTDAKRRADQLRSWVPTDPDSATQ